MVCYIKMENHQITLYMKSEFLLILGDLVHHHAMPVGIGIYRDEVISIYTVSVRLRILYQ